MNDFKILNYVKKFIISLEKVVLTFPKKDFISRELLYNDSLDLLELIYKANYEKESTLKHNYQIEIMAKINKIDFYLERAYKLRYISEKELMVKSNTLREINKMVYVWCYNDK